MSSIEALRLVKEQGPWCGLPNLLRKENGEWWQTRRWWVQVLVWLVVLNGPVAIILWLVPLIDPQSPLSPLEGLTTFVQVALALVPLGVMILTQSAIVREKQSGTAAWIMSNPVSRSAFILAKLIANTLSILVLLIWGQGLIAYLQGSARAGAFLPAGPFAASVGLVSLGALFYLTLSLMLGSLFRARGPVIGISIGFYMFQSLFIQVLPALKLDWLRVFFPDVLREMSLALFVGQPLPVWTPLLIFPLMGAAFIGIAIWRFAREEF